MPAPAGPQTTSAPPFDPAPLLAALRESEEAYQRLFELTPLPMWVRDVKTLRFLAVNRAAVADYGYTREEFLTMTVNDIRPPEEQERFRAFLEQRQADSEAADSPARSGRWRHRRKDGTLITVETWSHSLTFKGHRSRLVIVRDISEQLRAEAELRLERERFRLIAGATSDAIWDLDLASNTLWWGDSLQTLFGYDAAEFGDSLDSWVRAIHPEDRDRVVRSLETARAEARETWREEYRFRRRDGSYATVLDRGRLVRDASGRPTRMVGGMTDVTEQTRLQNQNLRAQRLESIGTLAGGIAHDLNNMLAPIFLALELLRMQAMPGSAGRYLDTIETSARRSADLVRQVLTFARGVEGQKAPIQIRHLLKEAARFAGETFPRNLRIQIEAPADLWTVQADATQVNQVLLNLALNARDAMPEGGQLDFSAENLQLDESLVASHPGARPGPYVVVTVSDTGVGIPPEHQERIFEPFFTTKEVGKGTGLGLATAHAIIREHGGFMSIRSSPGTGSSFSVFLPATPGLSPSFASPQGGSSTRGNGQTILVIDDEPALREITRHTLETNGYHVLTAADGAEGVALYAQNRDNIALVITDMAMPVMDGAATIVALHRINERLPIIATSGHEPGRRLGRAAQSRVSQFLAKPFTASQLLLAVRDALERVV